MPHGVWHFKASKYQTDIYFTNCTLFKIKHFSPYVFHCASNRAILNLVYIVLNYYFKTNNYIPISGWLILL